MSQVTSKNRPTIDDLEKNEKLVFDMRGVKRYDKRFTCTFLGMLDRKGIVEYPDGKLGRFHQWQLKFLTNRSK